MTTFAFLRRAALALCVVPLAACGGGGGTTAAPQATVTVTATPSAAGSPAAASPAPSPAASSQPSAAPTPGPKNTAVFDSPEDDNWPPITAKSPAPFGTQFQADPGHDFTKGISPSSDGVIRAELRTMTDENVVEYVPVKWDKDHFVTPPEGDVTAFAAPIASKVLFLSAVGCGAAVDQTINGDYLGTQRCSRDRLISRAVKGKLYALVTVRGGRVQKVVEIYTA